MIKMLTSIAADDFALKANDQTDQFTKEEEKRLVDSGLAMYVKTETAAKKKTS
jgi:hypothetical protein